MYAEQFALHVLLFLFFLCMNPTILKDKHQRFFVSISLLMGRNHKSKIRLIISTEKDMSILEITKFVVTPIANFIFHNSNFLFRIIHIMLILLFSSNKSSKWNKPAISYKVCVISDNHQCHLIPSKHAITRICEFELYSYVRVLLCWHWSIDRRIALLLFTELEVFAKLWKWTWLMKNGRTKSFWYV